MALTPQKFQNCFGDETGINKVAKPVLSVSTVTLTALEWYPGTGVRLYKF